MRIVNYSNDEWSIKAENPIAQVFLMFMKYGNGLDVNLTDGLGKTSEDIFGVLWIKYILFK